MKFEVGDIVRCKNINFLTGNHIRPSLQLDKEYPIKQITLDKADNQHLDVGLISEYEFIRSYETKEILPNSDIHWCHPSRFEHVNKAAVALQNDSITQTINQKNMFFKHKKSGAVISHDCYNKVPKRTTGVPRFEPIEDVKATHRFDDTVARKYDDDDDSFLTSALVGLAIAEVAEAVFDTSPSFDSPVSDPTPDFGGFDGGSGGGGGAGDSF